MSLIKFEQDVDYYFHIAVEYSDNGDFISCLKYLQLALKSAEEENRRTKYLDEAAISDYFSVKSEIASVYCDMGLYATSIKEFFKLYSCPDEFRDEIFFGLVKSYALLDMISQATYYFKLGVELGFLDPGDGMTVASLSEELSGEKFSLVENSNNEYMIQMAKQLAYTSDKSYAKQMLEAIPKESEQYNESQSLLSIIAISEGEGAAALNFAESALKVNPRDKGAMAAKIMALKAINDANVKNAESATGGANFQSGENNLDPANSLKIAVEDFTDEEIVSLEDAIRAASTMAHIGDAALTVKYTEKVKEFLPYDYDSGVLRALSYANLGNLAKAKKELIDLQIVYPQDITLKFFARDITNAIEAGGKLQKPFVLSSTLDEATQNKIFDEVEGFLSDAKTIVKANSLLKKDEDITEKLYYIFQSDNIAVITRVGSFLAQSVRWQPFIREKLIDPDFPVVAKKEFLLSILMFSQYKRFEVVVANIMRVFVPRIPNNKAGQEFEDAYWLVYCALAFIEADFDKKLNDTYKRICLSLKAVKNPDERVIAALLAYKSRACKIFSQKDYCCEIFDCEKEDFDKYIDIIKAERTLKNYRKLQAEKT